MVNVSQGLKLRLWWYQAFCQDLGSPSHQPHLAHARCGCRWSVPVDDHRGNHHDTVTHGSCLAHRHVHDRLVHHLCHHGQCFRLHDEGCPQSGCQYSTGFSAFHDDHRIPTVKNDFIQNKQNYAIWAIQCCQIILTNLIHNEQWPEYYLLNFSIYFCSHCCPPVNDMYIYAILYTYSAAECVTGQSNNRESCHSQGEIIGAKTMYIFSVDILAQNIYSCYLPVLCYWA